VAEHPKLLRANLEAEILDSPHNQNQARLDKMYSGMRMTPEERTALEQRQEDRARRQAMQDREGGRNFTAGPVPSSAEWDGAPAKAKPAQAPKPAANPTRPSPARRSRK
jgi:hypothetical protein